jgi:hypothetical protein
MHGFMATGASVEACEIPWAVAAIENMAGHLKRNWTNRMPSFDRFTSRLCLELNTLVPVPLTGTAL